jgi:eukaryotic-like serine/threonine-protein kinase
LNLKRNKKSLVKLSIIVCLLLTGILVLTSCVSGMQPIGWSGVTVSNGVVYTGSKEGRLVTYKPADGSRMWTEALKDSSAGSGSCLGGGSTTSSGGCGTVAAVAIYGSPVVSGDLVYIAGYNGKIYSYNTNSLQPRWVYPREGNLKPIVSGLTIDNSQIYFGCSDNYLYALDLLTGDFKWKFATEGEIWATPAVDNGKVFLSSFDKKIYAVDAASGKLIWSVATGATNVSTPITLDGIVYVGSLDRYFYALNENDGSVVWKKNPGENWFWTKPVAYKGIIYAPCMNGQVYGLDAKTGDTIFDYDTEGSVASCPVIVNGRLIVATKNKNLWSLSTDPAVKDRIKLTDIPEEVTAPLAAMDNIIYINGPDNSVRPYKLEDNKSTVAVLSPISIKYP